MVRFTDMMWRLVLLALVFVADAVMFVRLCRDELRDRRVSRIRASDAASTFALHDPIIPVVRQPSQDVGRTPRASVG